MAHFTEKYLMPGGDKSMTRDHVFIVGAGFSHYAGPPLTKDLTERLLAVGDLSRGPSTIAVEFLRRFVEETFEHKQTAAAQYWPYLEDVFTSLDLSANSGHHLGSNWPPGHLRTVRRALIIRIIRMLAQSYYAARQQRGSSWLALQSLFSQLDADNSAFLSMNWDVVIEEGLDDKQEIWNFDYQCAAQYARFSGTAIRVIPLRHVRSYPIVKLHGSTNWLYCDNCRSLFWFRPADTYKIATQLFGSRDWDVVESHLGYRYNRKTSPRTCPTCDANALGTRFATFSYRKALDFPMFERSWAAAEHLLRNAETWIFIGYSLPNADYEFKYLLKRVQLSRPRRPRLVLITGGEGSGDTQRNYQKLFGPSLSRNSGNCFCDGLNDRAIASLQQMGALHH